MCAKAINKQRFLKEKLGGGGFSIDRIEFMSFEDFDNFIQKRIRDPKLPRKIFGVLQMLRFYGFLKNGTKKNSLG